MASAAPMSSESIDSANDDFESESGENFFAAPSDDELVSDDDIAAFARSVTMLGSLQAPAGKDKFVLFLLAVVGTAAGYGAAFGYYQYMV